MLSVIVPVYNAEKVLNKCIDSIINQTYSNIEIVLINDGSTDKSGDICDFYAKKDNRIKVIHKDNEGQSLARNIGLDIMSGEYVAFVDSDDYISPTMFEEMIKCIDNYDVVICGHQIVKLDGTTLKRKNKIKKEIIYNNEQLWNEIFINLNNAVWNKIYKKELIGNIRFSKELHFGEDMLFNLQYLLNCSNGIELNEVFYNYLKSENSITTSAFSEKKLLEVKSKDIIFDFIKNNKPDLIQVAKHYCFKARMNVIRAIYKSDNQKKYKRTISVYKNELESIYIDVKEKLLKKEKVEYKLFLYFKFLYLILIKYVIK